MTTVSPEPTVTEREAIARAALITGLRKAADWLEANPAVPVGRHPSGSVDYVILGDYARLAPERALGELDRIAHMDDFVRREIRNSGTGNIHYRLAKHFGPVTYTAFAIVPDPAVKA